MGDAGAEPRHSVGYSSPLHPLSRVLQILRTFVILKTSAFSSPRHPRETSLIQTLTGQENRSLEDFFARTTRIFVLSALSSLSGGL